MNQLSLSFTSSIIKGILVRTSTIVSNYFRKLFIEFYLPVNFARIVPDGLLVFFPSYYILEQCIGCWKNTVRSQAHLFKIDISLHFFWSNYAALLQSHANSTNSSTIWERICKHKQPVIEPRQSSLFPSSIEASNINYRRQLSIFSV